MSKPRLRISVNFGETKLLVPCGDGSITIEDLIVKAIERYKKNKKMVRERMLHDVAVYLHLWLLVRHSVCVCVCVCVMFHVFSSCSLLVQYCVSC